MSEATLAQPDSNKTVRQWSLSTAVLRIIDARGRRWAVSLPLNQEGKSAFEGALGLLRFEARVQQFPELQRVRIELTIHNPRRARHIGGFWDLGDEGSLLVTDWSLEVATGAEAALNDIEPEIQWIETPGGDIRRTQSLLEIYQESSGGENWNSRNHANRDGRVPLEIRGYRVSSAEDERTGQRASPVVNVESGDTSLACALEEFWEQFPSSIAVTDGVVRVSFWPEQFPDQHELQAGEKNTRVVWLQYGTAGQTDWQALQDVHRAEGPNVDRGELASSGTVPFVPNEVLAPRSECRELVLAAIEGEQSFFAKREVIDEYGWRNFGEMWADHEEAYCKDPKPVTSHYNNQYDLLYGLLVQYIMSGDTRWWNLADPLARHVLDIDIYHTDRDRPLYNGGLFWHTNHYHDADHCTHRTYSNSMRDKAMPSAGGGPCNEHNYATGLLLYYKLTGNVRARAVVLGLADWVIAMDDGRQHILGVLSSCSTGFASCTAMADYHGPGRGSGNSINTLLDGWLAGGDNKYLAKAEELIRRTVHPEDNLESRDLSNAELRWSYTVHLQAIFRFLELTKQRNDLQPLRDYGRASLLHYARWMAQHEKHYLDSPEELTFPTETWAAQDIRKGVVLWMAALYSNGAERKHFVERGQEILDGAWGRLMQFESRTYTRPLALVLQQGYLETYLQARIQENSEPATLAEADFGRPEEFCVQKVDIRRRVKSIIGGFGLIPQFVNPARWLNAFRQTWAAERIRRLESGAEFLTPTRDAEK